MPAVRTGGIPKDATTIAYGVGYELGEFADGEFFASAGVDGLVARVVVHEVDAEVGEVVDVKKFAQR